MKLAKSLFLILWWLFVPSTAFAQPAKFHDSRDNVAVSVHIDLETATAGSDVVVAIVLAHEEHWHTHTNDPQVPPELGDPKDYYATAIEIELPEGSPLTVHDGFTQWPTPTIVEVAFTGEPVKYGVFSETVVIYVPITVALDAKAGKASLTIRPVFQACDEKICSRPTPLPDSAQWDAYGITRTINIVAPEYLTTTTSDLFDGRFDSVFSDIRAGVSAPSENIIQFDAFGVTFTLDANGVWGFILLLLVAMGGGFLLNLTPCVLPIIPIKIMGLSASAGNRRKTLLLGLWMMFGVMALWILLGVAIALVAGFTAINQLFQYPTFTIILGVFIGVMAIGMGGLFSIRLPNAVYKVNPKHDSWFGSFLFGVMTAVLSTPCTAPFMGAAAAWATTQSPLMTLSVFGAIGFGMAFPYLVLAAFPNLVEKMPRAGAASELIKQVMGLLMLAAAAYFVGVGLSGMMQQEGAPPSRLYLWFVAACIAAAGIWMSWRTLRVATSAMPKVVFVLLGVCITFSSVYAGIRLTEKGPIDWEYYSPELLQEKLEEGNVVVLEFTAEWCLNCKWLETNVLRDARMVEAFKADDVTPMKVDLTGNNVTGNALLNKVGGIRIPLLIIVGPDGEEDFRGDFYTVNQVLDAIKKSRSNE